MTTQTTIADKKHATTTNYNSSPNGYPKDDLREQILSIPIRSVIEKHVPLKSKGSLLVGICPFHNEKTPSFTVFEKTNTFKCFGCDASGNAIDFIIEKQKTDYPGALSYFKGEFNISVNGSFNIKKPSAEYQKVDETGSFKVVTKPFTKKELELIGPKITQELCHEYNFFAVDYYVTPTGHKWASTPEYPIFVFDFGTWKKIYQPLAEDKGHRFMYVDKDKRDKNFIYGLDQAQRKLDELKLSEEDESIKLDLTIKASGDRDALNLASLGYIPVWLDSEAVVYSEQQFSEIMSICKQHYNLPDIDDSGLNYSEKLNLKFLEIKTIKLPEELKGHRDNRGYQCKDFTDFVKLNSYETSSGKIVAEFKLRKLIDAAISLKFIQPAPAKKGVITYTIKNTRLYAFLSANGFFKYYPFSTNKNVVEIIRIQKNIIEKIQNPSLIEDFLINYLEDNLYKEDERDTFFRSKQVTTNGLIRGLSLKELTDKHYGPHHQCFFFNNNVWKITKSGIEEIPISKYENLVWEDQIIPKNVKRSEPLFQVKHTEDFEGLLAKEKNETDQVSKEALKKQIEEYQDIDKYDISISDQDFSLLRFIQNTSNFHWKKQKDGKELSEDELKENKLHFINKLWVLGYLMVEHKEKSKPFAPVFMDAENSEIGEHKGGTGKTITAELPFLVKANSESKFKVNKIDAQKKDEVDDKFVFANIDPKIPYVLFNDCRQGFEWHRYLNMIEGHFTVRRMHENPINLSYEESPKLAFTLNHGIKIDGSLSRRMVFAAFSDYYHSESDTNEKAFDPRMEFGKDLLTNYTDDEWNKTFNLLSNCVSLYFQFPNPIHPPKEKIKTRNTRQAIGEHFYKWAEDKLLSDIENGTLNEHMKEVHIQLPVLYKEFETEINLNTLPNHIRAKYSLSNFRKLIQKFCELYNIEPNHPAAEGYEVDRKRIRKTFDGKKVECFYFTKKDV